jgi:hypothetical protein
MRLDGFGLRFLVTTALSLTVGCPADDAPVETTDASTGADGTTTGNTTAPPATTAPVTGGSTDTGPATAGTTAGDTGATSTTSGGDSTTGGTGDTGNSTGDSSSSGDGSTTGEAVSDCVAGCAVEFSCTMDWASAEECEMACEANLLEAQNLSLFCRFAWEDLHACIGTLTCMEYGEYIAATMFPYPCWMASEALALECAGQ